MRRLGFEVVNPVRPAPTLPPLRRLALRHVTAVNPEVGEAGRGELIDRHEAVLVLLPAARGHGTISRQLFVEKTSGRVGHKHCTDCPAFIIAAGGRQP